MFLLRAATTASCMCMWLAAACLGRLFSDGSGGLPDPASGEALVETGMWCRTTSHRNAATFDVQDSLDESISCHILKAGSGRSLTAQTCLANVLIFWGTGTRISACSTGHACFTWDCEEACSPSTLSQQQFSAVLALLLSSCQCRDHHPQNSAGKAFVFSLQQTDTY